MPAQTPNLFLSYRDAGNHDNRNYEDDWGERYNGLVSNSDYEAQANQNHAKNLKRNLKLPPRKAAKAINWPTMLENDKKIKASGLT